MIHETGWHANILGFDHNITKKSNLPIVIACAVYTTTDDKEVLVIVNEAVLNANSPSTLMSEYQTREARNMVDSISKCHFHWDGTPGHQAMKLVCAADTKDPEVVIDFSIQSALSTMMHQLPMEDDLHTLPHYFATPAGVWIPRSQIDLGEPPIPPLHSSDTVLAQQAMCQQLDDAIHHAFSSMTNPTREGGSFCITITTIDTFITTLDGIIGHSQVNEAHRYLQACTSILH